MSFRMGLLVGGMGVAVVALAVVVILLATGGSDDSMTTSTSSSTGNESCPVARNGQPAELDLSRSDLDCIGARAVLGEYETVIAQQPNSSPGEEAAVNGWRCEAVPLAGYPKLVNCRSKAGNTLEVRSTAPYPAGDAARRTGPESPPAESSPGKPEPKPIFFQTPSGNIVCALSREAATCEIFRKHYTPYVPKPPSCQLDYGHRVSVGAYGPSEFACYGDSMRGIAEATLGYGREIRRGRIGCLSEAAGLICATVSGTGFALSVDTVRLL